MTNVFDHARTNETTRTPGYKWALAHILPPTPVSEWEKVTPARGPEQCGLLQFLTKIIWGSEFGRANTFAIRTNFRASQQNELRIKRQTKCYLCHQLLKALLMQLETRRKTFQMAFVRWDVALKMLMGGSGESLRRAIDELGLQWCLG